MSQMSRADEALGNVVKAALATALSISLGLPAVAQGMTAAPAQPRKADPSPAIPQPGSERMRSPADQEPFGYPSSTNAPAGAMDNAMGTGGVSASGGSAPTTLPDPGAGAERNMNSRSGYPTDQQQSGRITGTGRGPKVDPNWFGFLGLLGLGGLFGLRRRHSEEERTVYRERSRAA